MNALPDAHLHVYSVVNDAEVLGRDLQSSPDIVEGRVPLSVLWGARSASEAYAAAMSSATADILVFLHQDIYLPRGWFGRLARHVHRLNQIDSDWAVAGSSGVKRDGTYVGHLWDSGLGCLFGGPFPEPVRSASLDETILVVRRASGVGFDPQMPTFHLYGTDIVLSAEAQGKSAYIIDLPMIHNTAAPRRFRREYGDAYRFMIRKWRHQLPWPTVIVPLTTSPWALLYRQLISHYNRICHPEMFSVQLPNPGVKARELGFEDV
jgi:hypothetical protein